MGIGMLDGGMTGAAAKACSRGVMGVSPLLRTRQVLVLQIGRFAWAGANERCGVNFEVWPEAIELGQMFADEGFELALVGGPVRDLLLHRAAHQLA